MIAVDSVSFNFGKRHLLQSVSFAVSAGESVAISGQTGSGKSTLLSLLTGLLRFSTGDITVAGVDIRRASSRQLTALRLSSVGVVNQSGELLDSLTAVENVMVPMLLKGDRSHREAKARAEELCEYFHVDSPHLEAESLSGGERQRVALARAIANDPPVLLADEPTAALDASTRDVVTGFIYGLTQQDRAVAVITHDPVVAAGADRRFMLADAQLSEVAGER